MWWNSDRRDIAHLVKRTEIRVTLCGKKYIPLFRFKKRIPRVEIQCKTCLLVSEWLKDASLCRTVENVLFKRDYYIDYAAAQKGLSRKQIIAALSRLPLTEQMRDVAEAVDKYVEQAIVIVTGKYHLSDSVANGVVTSLEIDHEIRIATMNKHEVQRVVQEAKRLANERAQAKALEAARQKEAFEQTRKVEVERLNAQLQAERTARRREEQQRQQREAILQQRKATDLMAQKRAEGRVEVSCGCVVLVRDLEDNEDYTFYLRLPEPRDYVNGSIVYLDAPPIDVTPVSCDTHFSRGMCGRFVGDEVNIEAPNGAIRYLVLDVRHHSKFIKQPSGNMKVENLPVVENYTYSGRGKPSAGESQALDGSRNLGYMAREGNQWGSFPLYDDMSDESDAEGQDYDDLFEVDAYDSDD